ncbi:hypothetical protein [Methanolobus halotolerans]|uniref:hypothetical protein n=1 Tax=Methanolobus halotolerans TaxID=2052935 RepID=UPI001436C034|nr:hypothetical protein [Methanolobus halotolerans]
MMSNQQDIHEMLVQMSAKICLLEEELADLKCRIENHMQSNQEMREAHGLY